MEEDRKPQSTVVDEKRKRRGRKGGREGGLILSLSQSTFSRIFVTYKGDWRAFVAQPSGKQRRCQAITANTPSKGTLGNHVPPARQDARRRQRCAHSTRSGCKARIQREETADEPKGRDILQRKGPVAFKGIQVRKIKVRRRGRPSPQVDHLLKWAFVETRVEARVDSKAAPSPLFSGFRWLLCG